MVKKSTLIVLSFSFLLFVCGCATHTPPTPSGFTTQELINKAYTNHRALSSTLQEEKKSLSSLLLAITSVQGIVGDYSTLLTKSAQISSITRFIPLPYAGEVSNSAKLISSSLATLNIAMRDVSAYTRAQQDYTDSVAQYALQPTFDGLITLQEKGNTLLAKANEMEHSLAKISDLLQTLLSLSRSVGSILEKQQTLANDAKTFLGLSGTSQDDQSILLGTQKKFEASIATFSAVTLMLQHTKQRHEKDFYFTFCLTQLAKESQKKQLGLQ